MTKGYLDQSLHYLAARVAHRIGRHFYRQHLKPQKIKAAEWWVLTLLEEKDGLSISAIASHIFYDQPATTRLIERMHQNRLVQRRSSNADRRKVLVHITSLGRKKVETLQVLAIDDERKSIKSFNRKQLEDLKEALRVVLKDLGMAEMVDESEGHDLADDAA